MKEELNKQSSALIEDGKLRVNTVGKYAAIGGVIGSFAGPFGALLGAGIGALIGYDEYKEAKLSC